VAVIQCITIPDARHAAYARSDNFIRRYIFPGGHLPTVARLASAIAGRLARRPRRRRRESRPALREGDAAVALRLWREAFLREFDAEVRPALRREHARMGERDVKVFRRKWEYYFAYSEAGFATRTLGDVVVTVAREDAAELMEDVPL